MIPDVEVKFGKHLGKNEKEELVKKALNSSDFQSLLKVIAEKAGVNTKNYSIDVASKYEFTLPDNNTVFVNAAVLKFENLANAIYFEIIKPDEVVEAVIGGVRNDDVFLNLFVNTDGVGSNEVDYEGQLEISFADAFPNMEDYVEGQSKNDDVTPQFIDACYPGYKHCGKNCGDRGKYGGGTPINAMDTCCRAHDRCWYNFGSGDCQCDCEFIRCADANVNQSNAALYTIIRAVFSCC